MGASCLPSLSCEEQIARDGRSKGGVGVQRGQQVGGGNLQGLREAEEHQHRNIMQTMFDLADIGVMDARAGGEGRLGQAPLLPIVTEGRPKALEGSGVRGGLV